MLSYVSQFSPLDTAIARYVQRIFHKLLSLPPKYFCKVDLFAMAGWCLPPAAQLAQALAVASAAHSAARSSSVAGEPSAERLADPSW
eukprot:6143215-Pyramimonas_sp.AAC.1